MTRILLAFCVFGLPLCATNGVPAQSTDDSHPAAIQQLASGCACDSGSARSESKTAEAAPPQYEHDGIVIPRASGDEPVREIVSIPLASRYLEDANTVWNGRHRCISCHTNGTYLILRPALSASLGLPRVSARDFFLTQLEAFAATDPARLQTDVRPAQVIYLAAGLAEWDAHVTNRLSTETQQALSLMLRLQHENGTWGSKDCWPPYESDAFHLATVAAMAVAAAPGWLNDIADSDDQEMCRQIERLKTYLRTSAPHDYGRTLLLWADARLPDLIDEARRSELIDLLREHQRDDGGWSIRTMAAPEAWGRGNRASKIRGEPDFESPASDGHMTGLAIVVLRESGVPADDPQVERGLEWLNTNQRESGRWWTRSLNTDGPHFITYSGTALPLLALQLGRDR